MIGERFIVAATIFLHPSLLQRIPMGDIVRRLERAGYALSNVRAKHHSYEARMIRNVPRMRRSGVDDQVLSSRGSRREDVQLNS